MIIKTSILETESINPYYNLAMEEYLLNQVKPGECILYLWQNKNTVVIGRNQNAIDECHTAKLYEDGGHLARRLSGGGAVYHDLGNLNFTFLVRSEDYDVAKQTDVILKAVQMLGICAQKNGRNDLTVDGSKFSGHAYYKTNGRCYHHGTIMIDVKEVGTYLTPSKDKLKSKGVVSVRSRVKNLAELAEGLTIEKMKTCLVSAFSQVYQMEPESYHLDGEAHEIINKRKEFYESEKWIYRIKGQGEIARKQRFDWGEIVVHFDLFEKKLNHVEISSDSLEADYIDALGEHLEGILFEKDKIEEILLSLAQTDNQKQIARDISCLMFKEEQNEF